MIVKINELHPHPAQAEIYGDNADQRLIDSIEEHGLTVPINIVDGELYGLGGSYVIISGHRRVDAMKRLGKDEIEAYWEKGESRILEDINFSNYNLNREKTEKQKINEFLYIKQKLCQIAKHKQTWASSENKKNIPKHIRLILLQYNIDVNERINVRELTGYITGLSEYIIKLFTALFDDEYLDIFINKYIDCGVITQNEADKLVIQFEEFRESVLNGDITYNQAYKEVQDLKKRFEKDYKKILKKKAKKEDLTKKEADKLAKPVKAKNVKPVIFKMNYADMFFEEKIDLPLSDVVMSYEGVDLYNVNGVSYLKGQNGLKRVSSLALIEMYNRVS